MGPIPAVQYKTCRHIAYVNDYAEVNGGTDALVADQGGDPDGPVVTLYTPDEDQTVGF